MLGHKAVTVQFILSVLIIWKLLLCITSLNVLFIRVFLLNGLQTERIIGIKSNVHISTETNTYLVV